MHTNGILVDISGSRDARLVQDLAICRAIVQTTLDLIQAGDVEPGEAAVATISGVPRQTLRRYFPSRADLYAATLDLAVRQAVERERPVDTATPLAHRIRLLVADRARLFEEWFPVWRFAERVQDVLPAVGGGISDLRRLLRDRLVVWFAAELGALDTRSRGLVLESLEAAFGLDGFIHMRKRFRQSPYQASRSWRFAVESSVLQALAPSPGEGALT